MHTRAHIFGGCFLRLARSLERGMEKGGGSVMCVTNWRRPELTSRASTVYFVRCRNKSKEANMRSLKGRAESVIIEELLTGRYNSKGSVTPECCNNTFIHTSLLLLYLLHCYTFLLYQWLIMLPSQEHASASMHSHSQSSGYYS